MLLLLTVLFVKSNKTLHFSASWSNRFNGRFFNNVTCPHMAKTYFFYLDCEATAPDQQILIEGHDLIWVGLGSLEIIITHLSIIYFSLNLTANTAHMTRSSHWFVDAPATLTPDWGHQFGKILNHRVTGCKQRSASFPVFLFSPSSPTTLPYFLNTLLT